MRKRYQKGTKKLCAGGAILEPFWRKSEHRDPGKKNDFLGCLQNSSKVSFGGIMMAKGPQKVSKREHLGGLLDVFLRTCRKTEKCVWTAQACTDCI